MPDEIMIIAVVAIVMGTVVSMTKLIIGHLRDRQRLPAEEGVRTSDLRQLMIEAVEEANAPLHARIERLEARLDAPALRSASEDADQPEPVPAGRRIR